MTVTNKEAQAKLVKARAALILDNPFFGSLALRLRLLENRSIPTLAVDGKHVFYNPDFIMGLSLTLTKSAMAHEVMHCVWSHIGRRQGRDPRKWNFAGDYVINDMLKNLKDKKGNHMFEIGQDWLWSAQFSGPDWSADKVYNHLPDNPGGGAGNGQKGGALCDIMDGPPGEPKDASERAAREREWKVATIQAANAAKAVGALPGDLERFLDDLMKPQVNWVEKLRNFVNQVTRNDYNWMRPNKRFAPDLYMPSLHNETMGDIAVIIDDSGSINQATLNVFASEIVAIMQDVRPNKTHLIYCDAAVGGYYAHDPDDKPEFKVHGGGGTNFAPPFEYMEEHEIEPMCAIYLTDLMGPHGPEPGYPVLWVCINDAVAPWGETVHIDEVPEQ